MPGAKEETEEEKMSKTKPIERAPRTDREATLRELRGKVFDLRHDIAEETNCSCEYCREIDRLERVIDYQIKREQDRESAERETVYCDCHTEMKHNGNEWQCPSCRVTRPDDEPR